MLVAWNVIVTFYPFCFTIRHRKVNIGMLSAVGLGLVLPRHYVTTSLEDGDIDLREEDRAAILASYINDPILP
jgi:hypothetical protein